MTKNEIKSAFEKVSLEFDFETLANFVTKDVLEKLAEWCNKWGYNFASLNEATSKNINLKMACELKKDNPNYKNEDEGCSDWIYADEDDDEETKNLSHCLIEFAEIRGHLPNIEIG